MQLVEHPKHTKPTAMTLGTQPMTVYLSPTLELLIERGDTLRQVAAVISEHWPIKKQAALKAAAFWFAIGERVARNELGDDWTTAELDASPMRRYLR